MWETYSGDKGTSGLFKKKPTKKEVLQFIKTNLDSELEAGTLSAWLVKLGEQNEVSWSSGGEYNYIDL